MRPTRIEMDRILCPVDFSEFSGPALEHAVRLGKWFGCRVEALHVITPSPRDPAEVARVEREHANLALGDLVAPLLREGVPLEAKVLEGEPWRLIVEEAEGLPADLLVIGTHGRSGLEHLLLGSVTEKVLRRAPCGVLTVGNVTPRPCAGSPFRRILCAADLTEASDQTIAAGLSLASENDATLVLLHVIDSYQGLPEIGPTPRDKEIAARRLSKAIPEAANSFCEVSERVEAGAAWREILRVADEMAADLVVMGAHARSEAGWKIFGSTTSRVVRRATRPVLVIRENRTRWSSVEAGRETEVAACGVKGGRR